MGLFSKKKQADPMDVANEATIANMVNTYAEADWRILSGSYDAFYEAQCRLRTAFERRVSDKEFKKQITLFIHRTTVASRRFWVANGLSKRDYQNVVAYFNAISDVIEDSTSTESSWKRNNCLSEHAHFVVPRTIARDALVKTPKKRKALGFALIVLGVALLIATAAFCIASWGTLTPVAPVIGLGANSVIAAGIAMLGLSTAVSSCMAIGATGFGLLSFYKAKHCFQVGASKDVADAGKDFISYLESKKTPSGI